MTSLAGMSYCTLFDTGERRINFLRKRYSTPLKSAEPRSEEPGLWAVFQQQAELFH